MNKILMTYLEKGEKRKVVAIVILFSGIFQFLLIGLIFRLDSVILVMKFGLCIIFLGFLQLLMFNLEKWRIYDNS